LTHREPVKTDIKWCPALLALLLLTWRFFPGLRRAQRSWVAKPEPSIMGRVSPSNIHSG
jgi:mxaL protein